MSVKIGVGFGGWPFPDSDPERLWEYVDACEALGIDSIWLSDRIVSEVLSLEPLIALSFIAARTRTLKLGTSVLALPLRSTNLIFDSPCGATNRCFVALSSHCGVLTE